MIGLPRIQAVGRLSTDTLPLRLCHGRLNRGSDILSNLVLYGEDVGEVSVVSLSPKVRAGRGLDDLSSNPDAGSCLPYASFEHKADAELPPDLFDVDGSPLVSKARIASDNK